MNSDTRAARVREAAQNQCVVGLYGFRIFLYGETVSVPALIALPPGARMVIFPLVAPEGTKKVRLVELMYCGVVVTPLMTTFVSTG